MTRIGVLGHGFIDWGGGLDFLRLVCGSLAAASEPVELHLLLPTRGPRITARKGLRIGKRLLLRGLGRAPLQYVVPTLSQVRALADDANFSLQIHEIDIGRAAIRRASQALGLSGLLPACLPVGSRGLPPWLGYIPDLQHRQLPHFFSSREIKSRDHRYSALLKQAKTVIVNSQTVRSDILEAYPSFDCRVLALPFAPAPNPDWLNDRPVPREKYGVAERYFIISNQFWQHKDHRTAWQALAQLQGPLSDVQLVCTGETHDYRNPAHFQNLVELAASLGISERLRILGLIPKADQIALLRSAVAVIQPTLFEGGPGGGSVYDAVSLGVPAIVSDIAVNQEIDEPTVTFFRKSQPEHLAQCMREQLTRSSGARHASPNDLLQQGQDRRRRCGDLLLSTLSALSSPASILT